MSDKSIKYEEYKGLDAAQLDEIFNGIRKINIALIGDLCLDIYWHADMRKSELSRETPHYTLPIIDERISPGAGGNVVCNLAALMPEKIIMLGVIGRNWRGDLFKEQFSGFKNVDISYVIESEKRITEAFCKLLRKGIADVVYEDPRLDFLNYEKLCMEDEEALISSLDDAAGKVDIICVSDQNTSGCISKKVREKINELGRHGHRIIVDSRDNISRFRNVILKPNELEGWRAIYRNDDIDGDISKLAAVANMLSHKNHSSVCMTLGAKGCMYSNSVENIYIPSYKVDPPLDICGAGDTFLSAFACSVAAGAKPPEAASFANLAADVTVAKTGMTGTASMEEIKKRHKEIFKP